VLDLCEQDGKYNLFLGAVREWREMAKLLSQLEGRLASAPVMNVLVMPQVQDAIGTIIEALQPYPDAKVHVIDMLNNKLRGTPLPTHLIDSKILVDN